MRRRYGASPAHALAHLAAFALCGWALVQIVDARAADTIVVWLVASVVLHDLVLLPLYSAADGGARRLLGDKVNYVRVPAGLSLLMLAVFFGTIAERGEGAYRAVSGLEYEGYATRWLLVSAALFAGSAALYWLRRRRAPYGAPRRRGGGSRS